MMSDDTRHQEGFEPMGQDTIGHEPESLTTSPASRDDMKELYTQYEVQELIDRAYDSAAQLARSAASHAYANRDSASSRRLEYVERRIKDLKGRLPQFPRRG